MSSIDGGRARPPSLARDLERHPRPSERRAELVADRREELALIAHDARDPVRHLVEGLRHAAHLVGDPTPPSSQARPRRRGRPRRSARPRRRRPRAATPACAPLRAPPSRGRRAPPRAPRARSSRKRRRSRRRTPRAPTSSPSRTTGMKPSPWAPNVTAPPRSVIRCGRLLTSLRKWNVEADDVADARDVRVARLGVVPVAREMVRDRAGGHVPRRRRLGRPHRPGRQHRRPDRGDDRRQEPEEEARLEPSHPRRFGAASGSACQYRWLSPW